MLVQEKLDYDGVTNQSAYSWQYDSHGRPLVSPTYPPHRFSASQSPIPISSQSSSPGLGQVSTHETPSTLAANLYPEEIRWVSPHTGEIMESQGIGDYNEIEGANSKKKKNSAPKEKDWKTEDVEKLIRLWQEHGELYLVNHPQYHDRAHKTIILKIIADDLQVTTADVQKKMKGLHSYYLQLKRDNKRKSGDAAKKKIKWAFYESLQFMDEKNPVATVTDTANFLDTATTDFSVAPESASAANLFTPPPLERRHPAKNRC